MNGSIPDPYEFAPAGHKAVAGLPAYPLSEKEIYGWTGSPDQLFQIRRYMLKEGPGSGLAMIEINTIGGLHALFCESHALDLYELHVKGVNLGFKTKNGPAGTQQHWLTTGEFQQNWPAGFLATCGLRNTGPDCQIGDEYHPLHGRVGQTAADRISILTMGVEKVQIKGYVRESALFGHYLELERTITLDLQNNRIVYADRVHNRAAEAEAVFFLYHINFGYPFLSPALSVTYPDQQPFPRTDVAQAGLSGFQQISAPVDGEPEQVFFHVPDGVKLDLKAGLSYENYPEPGSPDDRADVFLESKACGIKARLGFNWSQLPVLTQWKSMKSGDYALGIEPGNSLIRGRKAELAVDGFHKIPGYGYQDFGWELELT